MSDIRYVKIKRPDTPKIREMVRLFTEETGADQGACEMIQNRLSKMEVFGALNNHLVGIGGYYVLGADKVVFDFLYVQSEYRSRSIAGRLHRMAVEEVKKSGIKKILVFAKPERAIGYMKRGYADKLRLLELDL